MRSLALISAVVLLAGGAAFGQVSNQSVTIDLLGPGGVDTYAPAPGETFRVDIFVSCSDPAGMQAADMFLSAPAGFDILASEDYFGMFTLNYADIPAAPFPGNSTGWSVANDYTQQWAAGPADGTKIGAAAADAPAGNGWFAYVDITAPAEGIAGKIGIGNTIIGDSLSDTIQAGNVTVNGLAVPEPASALLLLAGLPFLRRRR